MDVGGRVVLRALAVTAVLLGLIGASLPGTAASADLDPAVAERRTAWAETEAELEEAEGRRDDLALALAAAEAEERRAADTLDAETARLVQLERELDAAAAVLSAAQAAAAEAAVGLRQAIVAYERALEHTLRRRAELGVAAASAYATGDPRVKVLNGLVHALDSTANVSEFLATTERLAYVTREARGQFDLAEDDLAERGGDALVAAEILSERRRAEHAAAEARDAAADAVAAQRTRRDAALAAHDDAVALVETLAGQLGAAELAVAAAFEALVDALAALESLGWRAGVPGPLGLVWPVDGRPGSGFGPRMHPILGELRRHLGVDVGAPSGQAVVAAADGDVVHAGPRGGYGLTVVLDHGEGRTTLYAHLSTITVRRGERVAQAGLIGRVGSTGMSTGPHLHFEVRERGQPVDPLRYFR